MLTRLALGTAQFGLPYGISEHHRQATMDEICRVISFCRSHGVTTLDTAIAYGNSEAILGEAGVGDFDVITKLPPCPLGDDSIHEWVLGQILGSLGRLGLKKLKGVLLHQPRQLLEASGNRLYRSLVDLRDSELTSQIGISVYSPEELDAVLTRFPIDVVQLPFNVVDRRFHDTGWISRLKNDGVEVHARSVFLQGLLLMDGTARPQKFNKWQQIWDKWEQWLRHANRSAIDASIRFVTSFEEIDRIVIGIHAVEQLAEVCSIFAMQGDRTSPDVASNDLSLIDPSKWTEL